MTTFESSQVWQPIVTGGSGRMGRVKSAVREGSATIDTSIEADAEEAKRWIQEQIPYDNLAGRRDVAERAVRFAAEHRKQMETKMAPVYRRWDLHLSNMRGNSNADTFGLDAVHVPESYKAREAIVVRLEKAIYGSDPSFDVVGIDRIDRRKALVMRGWLQHCLDKIDYNMTIQPANRLLADHSFYCRKWYWDYREMDGVEVTRKAVPGDVWEKTKIERKRAKVILANHPNFDLVRPWNFLIDTEVGNVRDVRFVGDDTYMTMHEILRMVDLGLFEFDERLKTLKPSMKTASMAEAYRRNASVTERNAGSLSPPPGSPGLFRVSERWGWYDLYDRGEGREVMACVTTVEDQVCVRAIENFYDARMLPYSICRSAEEAFDFFNTDPAGHALPLSAELDVHETLAREAHKISVCPHFMAEEDRDGLPDSILGLLPGSVIPAGKGQWMRPPDTLASWPAVREAHKQDIQEVWGSPNIYFGADAQGTATEVERRTQEGNERLGGLYRAVGRAFRTDLQLVHALCAQFVTSKQQFRVHGRTAKLLGGPDQRSTISPLDFEPKVDFIITTLGQTHTLGGRAAGIANFMGRNAPLLPMYGTQINVPALIEEDFRLTVGSRQEDEIFNVDRSLEEVISPQQENSMMRDGQDLEVHPLDPDEDHIPVHEKAKREEERKGNYAGAAAIEAHTLNHMMAAQQKDIRRKAAAGRAPSQPQPAMQPQNGQPRPSDLAGSGTAPRQTPRGEAAGPPAAGKVAAAGRKQPSFQTDSRGAGR